MKRRVYLSGLVQAPAADSFYERQYTAREAGLKAGPEVQYENGMRSYQDGCRRTPPNC